MSCFGLTIVCFVAIWLLLMINAIRLLILSQRLKLLLNLNTNIVMKMMLSYNLNPVKFAFKTLEIDKKDSQEIIQLKQKLKPVVYRHFFFMFLMALIWIIAAICLSMARK